MVLNSLQFTIIGISVFIFTFRRKRRNSKSRIVQLCDPIWKGHKNLSSPSKRDDEPAHMKTIATA